MTRGGGSSGQEAVAQQELDALHPGEEEEEEDVEEGGARLSSQRFLIPTLTQYITTVFFKPYTMNHNNLKRFSCHILEH